MRDDKRLNIVILVVGTLGDVLPFIQIGRRLQSDGHRVRLATHVKLQSVVEKAGLEYCPIGGDPETLCDYLCRNQGTLPSHDDASQLLDDYQTMMSMVEDMALSTWHACTTPWPLPSSSLASRSVRTSPHHPLAYCSSSSATSVAAAIQAPDVIIANLLVPSALHCASRLDCHLHLMFPQPWASSAYLPHPLWGQGLPSSPPSWRNRATHVLLDELHHLSWRHAIDRLRATIGLPRLRSADFGAHLQRYHKVPLSVLCSPRLLPRPPDWGPHIRITGAITTSSPCTHDSSTRGSVRSAGKAILGDSTRQQKYGTDIIEEEKGRGITFGCIMAGPQTATRPASEVPPLSSSSASPPPGSCSTASSSSSQASPLSPWGASEPLSSSLPSWLHKWLLQEGEDPVVLVCFGSMVVPLWATVEDTLRQAAARASVRVLLHRTSGIIQADCRREMVSSCRMVVLEGRLPHAQLLPYCRAMLHHGGAGTTYTSLQAGKPSMAMPFFGDQFLWADILRREGVSPAPSPSPLWKPTSHGHTHWRAAPVGPSIKKRIGGHLQLAGLETDTMARVLQELVKEEYASRAQQLAHELHRYDRDGVDQAVHHFYHHYHESIGNTHTWARRGFRYEPLKATTVWQALAQGGRGLVEDTTRAAMKVVMTPVGGWIDGGGLGLVKGVGAGLTQGLVIVIDALGDAMWRVVMILGDDAAGH